MARTAAVLTVLAVAVAGCFHGEAADERAGQGRSIPIRVVQGPDGGTLALVDVTVGGRGPYTFAVDTGASRSLVDTSVVADAGLERTGTAQEVRGILGVDRAGLVRVGRWRAGEVDLPAKTVFAVDLPHPGEEGGIRGLLGSDVLVTFGSATVDYARERLVLGGD